MSKLSDKIKNASIPSEQAKAVANGGDFKITIIAIGVKKDIGKTDQGQLFELNLNNEAAIGDVLTFSGQGRLVDVKSSKVEKKPAKAKVTDIKSAPMRSGSTRTPRNR